MTSLRSRFYTGLLILACVTLITSLYHLYEIRVIHAKLAEVQRNAVPSVLLANRMEVEAVQVQQWLTDVSATGDREGYKEAKGAYRNFKIGLEEFRKVPGNEKIADHDTTLKDFESYYALGNKMADAYLDDGQAAGNRSMREFDEQAVAIAGRIAKLRAASLDRVGNASSEIENTITVAWYSNLAQLAVVLVLVVGAGIGMYRGFLRPVYGLRDSLQRALQENDLGARIPGGNAAETSDCFLGECIY